MTLFSAWLNLSDDRNDPGDANRDGARRAIAAGEQLFDSAPVYITNVRGLNDNAALGKPDTLTGTCTTCHDAPNIGNHSLPLPLDIGTSHSRLPGAESDPNVAAALPSSHCPTCRSIRSMAVRILSTPENLRRSTRPTPAKRSFRGLAAISIAGKGRFFVAWPHVAAFSQRCRSRSARARKLLQQALPDGSDRGAEARPGRVPQLTLRGGRSG